VRSIGVVLPAPALDVKLGVAEGEKHVRIEAFVPQFAVDALDESVLPTRCNPRATQNENARKKIFRTFA